MTGNRMNCSLWFWLRRPTEFKELVRYCNAFGWQYFWRDTFLSIAKLVTPRLLIAFGSCVLTASVLMKDPPPVWWVQLGSVTVSVVAAARWYSEWADL